MSVAIKKSDALPCSGSADRQFAIKTARMTWSKSGITLLEVILSLAILGVSVGVLLQIGSNATNLSQRSQRLTQAQIFADSKMSEIIAGLTPAQPTSFVQTGIDFDGVQWYASINIVPAETQNMLGIAVTVTDDPTGETGAATQFTLTRAIIDPTLGLDVPPETDATEDGSGQSNSSQPNAGGTGGLGVGTTGGNAYGTGGGL